MKINYLLAFICFFGCISFAWGTYDAGNKLTDPYKASYHIAQDTIPLQDRTTNFLDTENRNPFDLNDPATIQQEVEYDPETNSYFITERIGSEYYRAPTSMTFSEYMDYREERDRQELFQRLSGVTTGSSSGLVDPIGQVDVKKDLIDRLFGGSAVKINPQGNIDLTLGADFSRTANPSLPLRTQRQGGFDFDMAIQMNVDGQIGEKLKLSTNYNTQATFGFDNQMKLDYDTDAFSEDEIIKKIEAGDVALPLKGTLIQGAQRLFGLKTEVQFGRLRLTGVASQNKSRRQNIQVEGGSQLQEFEVRADQYDENRHFFLTHFNRDNFEVALENLPQVKSLFFVKNIEIWVTNTRNETEDIVDIIAMADMGEPSELTSSEIFAPSTPRNPIPNAPTIGLPGFVDQGDTTINQINFANDLLYDIKTDDRIRDIDRTVNILQSEMKLQAGIDFNKISARKLRPNEYTLNPQLGTVSLNLNLQPDDVLGVAFEYSYNGKNYQVGEMTGDNYNPEELGVLFVKMLKSSVTRVDKPIWDLMMKNVYSLGAFQVSNEDFLFDIYYEDPGAGFKRFLPETNLKGLPLLRVFNLDRLNVQGDPCPDGIFDFVPGITINPKNGRIMFPVLEPFGANLVEDIDDQAFKEKYEYFHLYDSTLTRAREYPDLNRFALRGSYKSSISSEISLNSFNLPPGSVKVSAGGVQLSEEAGDYEVDYNIGKVRILNDAYLNSGTPINVSFEDNSLFTFQQKTLLGLRADYEFNKNFTIGATYMHLFERPFTQKVNIGDDPISNRMVGFDMNYSNEAPWLTKLVDAIPGIQTKAPSSVTFAAEAAFLKPGHARAINLNGDGDDKGGTLNIDDFEGSATGFDLRNPTNRWVLASIPQNDVDNNNPLFEESKFIDSLQSGMNRAKLAWYRIDDAVRNAQDREDPYTSRIQVQEVFPNRPNANVTGQTNQIPSLDLRYIPDQKGPYNFDTPGNGSPYSAGLDFDGNLKDPASRWAGIMRALPNNDFEAANIEYIEFWLCNPFIDSDNTNSGDLYINLGNVSEDILKDSRRAFENGLPTDNKEVRTDTTGWGRVPRVTSFTNAFSQDENDRRQQDVGYDGFDDPGERIQYDSILTIYSNSPDLSDAAKTRFNEDPASDNFVFFRNPSFGQLGDAQTRARDRYLDNNNPQGNSEASTGNQISSATNIPDAEDLNRDNSLNEVEQYFQYKIELQPTQMANGEWGLDAENNDLITDVVQQSDAPDSRTWYRFRIPIEGFDTKVGGIQDFRSIQFMRMYLTNFTQEVTLRFATLELTRNQWRKYRRSVDIKSLSTVPTFPNDFQFDLNAVSLEENSQRLPFNYVLPPGVERESIVTGGSAAGALPQNEQSLSILVDDLPIDSAVGVYKIIDLDMRVFEEMELFVHAEPRPRDQLLDDGEMAMFIRIGSDFENNFYEYELPLTLSDTAGMNNDPEVVWPDANRMLVNLKQFIEMKKQRNAEGFSLTDFYELEDTESPYPGRKYRLKGNPNLGLAKGIMIGLVNRDLSPNDPEVHSAEIWVNELRVHGLDEAGAGAALARVDFKLADFGGISLASNYSSNGWGGIEQKLAQRAREEVFQYDAAANFELGKFFGDDSGIKIPMYASLSKTIRTPQFDPYDLDIPLREKIQAAPDQSTKDSIRSQAQDVTSIKSLNFTNVRKTKTNQTKSMPWDISNFSATYALVETERNNPIIESDREVKQRGALDYSYQIKPLYIEPFKKIIKKDKYLKLISEANINLVPNSFSFSTNLDRESQTTKYRFTDLGEQFNTFFNKRFTWDRNYNLNWDITRALKVNFSAINRAIVDELKQFGDDGFAVPEKVQKDFLRQNIRDFGRTKDYSHNIGANYTLPFKKIPLLDFINVKASYTATYNWAGSAVGMNTYDGSSVQYERGIADSLGNVIQNKQDIQINGEFNFETLYKKSKYLTSIDRPKGKGRTGRGNSRGARGEDAKGNNGSDDGNSGSRRDRGNRRDSSKSSNSDTLDKDSKENSGSRKSGKNGKDAKGKDKDGNAKDGDKKKDNKKDNKKDKAKDKKKRQREPSTIERIVVRPLLMLRKARFNYTENRGTVVPGFKPRPNNFGLGNNLTAPGWDFIVGVQPDFDQLGEVAGKDWLEKNSSWISDNHELNQRASQTYSQNYDVKVSLEPFNDFKIELNANKRFEKNDLSLFKYFDDDDFTGFEHRDLQTIGSFSISYFALGTLFGTDSNVLFERFEDNRSIISQRLNPGTTHDDLEVQGGYADGYGRVQESVLVPAFLAAYTGDNANTMMLQETNDTTNDYTKILFKSRPKINWNLTYNGLSKVGNLKDIFQSVKLTHGYKSNLTVNSYNNDQAFNQDLARQAKDDNSNYYSRFQIPNMVISEQFAPLLGLSVKTKGGMDFNVDFKKARNLSMSFSNFVLSEQKTEEYIVGFGYTMENVYIPLFYGKKGKRKKKRNSRKTKVDQAREAQENPKDKDKKGTSKGSDLNFKFDFSLRDDVTLNHSLDQDFSEETRGTRSLTISPSVDYDINEQLNVRLFFDHRSTTPKTSLGFPTSNTSAGVTVRFSLN